MLDFFIHNIRQRIDTRGPLALVIGGSGLMCQWAAMPTASVVAYTLFARETIPLIKLAFELSKLIRVRNAMRKEGGQ